MRSLNSILQFISDEDEENQPSPFKTPSPCKIKKENVHQRRDETPVRASLAAKLAASKLEEENKKGI